MMQCSKYSISGKGLKGEDHNYERLCRVIETYILEAEPGNLYISRSEPFTLKTGD